jgi:hypothetical protein
MRYTGLLPTFGKDTPMRLSKAARLAFPDGSIKSSGLRKEAKRGRLVIERIAGKDYTTLQHIEEMRQLCRVERKVPTSTSESESVPPEKASGLSLTGTNKLAVAAAKMSANKLKRRSGNI